MRIGVPTETFPEERRVALTPDAIVALTKARHEVIVQAGAGDEAGLSDNQYRDKSAKVVADRAEVFQSADVLFQVRGLGANPEAGHADLELLHAGQALIAQLDPLWKPDLVKLLAQRKVLAFALELMPRITRAQSMDVLSSQATVAGYKAVLVAAAAAPRMFPMFMTAAGTITPAHVFVIGAGVGMYTALGVNVGTEEDERALNFEKLRYHKVIIMCDADIDGSHITTLILTFFFRYMNELIEHGYIYIATPPLYLVKKGKDQRYCWSDKERDEMVADINEEIESRFIDMHPNVENVQDIVEKHLMRAEFFDIAKAYILYRAKRQKERE